MESDAEKVKARLNVVDVVGQYTVLKRAGKNFTARCPFHKERTPSFYVSPERGTYICFGCGEKGDVFSFVQKMEGIDFRAALTQLAQKAGVELQKGFVRPVEEVEKSERLIQICEVASDFFQTELKRRKDVQQYLHTRGVLDETISTWRVGYAPASWEDLSRYLLKQYSADDVAASGLSVKSEKKPGSLFDRFRGRIMFPISDAAGKPIAFSGRFFEKVPGQKDDIEPAKYINSPETLIFKKSRTLYGYDKALAAIRKLDCILLVEGQFDLILAHQSGLPFTVALSGTALTEEHIVRLGRLSKRLVLALDADSAGVRAGLRSAHLALSHGFDVKVPTFPEGKDPADVAKENPELLKAAIRTSRTAIEFFLDYERRNAKDERSYQKLVETNILPLVAAIQSRIDQEHFIRLVAQKLAVPESAVRAEVMKLGSGKRPSSPPLQNMSAQLPVSPIEKKAGMLIFYFGADAPVREHIEELLGKNRVEELLNQFEGEAETFRFRFEQELGEHSAETIAHDMLEDIKRQVEKDRFKRQFL